MVDVAGRSYRDSTLADLYDLARHPSAGAAHAPGSGRWRAIDLRRPDPAGVEAGRIFETFRSAGCYCDVPSRWGTWA